MSHDQGPHVPHLGLRLATVALQVHELFAALPAEGVMTAADARLEAATLEETAELLEAKVGVGCAAENLVESPVLAYARTPSRLGEARLPSSGEEP